VSVLRLEGVHVSRRGLRATRADGGKQDGDDNATVLRDVSLDVAEGGVLSLLGESGGGKSTLLRLANRLVEPEQGAVTVGGRLVVDWPIAELRRAAVFVGQRPAIFGGTVADELRRPLEWAGREADEAALREALVRADLKVPLTRASDELSGGEQTRLALARATLLEPRVLLLDEPTGSLDVRTAANVLARIREWATASGVALLCVTHRPRDLVSLGGSAAVLLAGKLHGPFPSESVADASVVDDAVREFLGALPAGGEA
jgi:ABC-type methionine transport system ATPase subunit